MYKTISLLAVVLGILNLGLYHIPYLEVIMHRKSVKSTIFLYGALTESNVNNSALYEKCACP